MEPLYEAILHLPDYDGYFGYRVFKEYVEYVDIDNWGGNSEPKYWSHQEFYKEFNSKKDQEGNMLERAVIVFLVENKLVE